MGEPICRRDFLNAAALATGSAFMSPLELLAARDDWTGYGGVGDYRFSNGNTKDVMDAAHAIRDRRFQTLPRDATDTGEAFDLVVVGGGLTGLAAALFFERQGRPGQTCLVLDDHAIFGGEAKGNRTRSRATARTPRRRSTRSTATKKPAGRCSRAATPASRGTS